MQFVIFSILLPAFSMVFLKFIYFGTYISISLFFIAK